MTQLQWRTLGVHLYICKSWNGKEEGRKAASHLRGQQPPVLREVQDGLHHPVWVQQAEDVPNAWLLPK